MSEKSATPEATSNFEFFKNLVKYVRERERERERARESVRERVNEREKREREK